MTAVSKTVYTKKLDEIVNKFNSTYHKAIMCGVIIIVWSSNSVEHNDKDCKFEVVDHVRMSKLRNIFAKGYTLNWSEDVFVIK